MSLAAAQYSSEDAAQVVEYIQAVIDVTRKSIPYKTAMQALVKLNQELNSIKIKKAEREEEKSVSIEEVCDSIYFWVSIVNPILFLVDLTTYLGVEEVSH